MVVVVVVVVTTVVWVAGAKEKWPTDTGGTPGFPRSSSERFTVETLREAISPFYLG